MVDVIDQERQVALVMANQKLFKKKNPQHLSFRIYRNRRHWTFIIIFKSKPFGMGTEKCKGHWCNNTTLSEQMSFIFCYRRRHRKGSLLLGMSHMSIWHSILLFFRQTKKVKGYSGIINESNLIGFLRLECRIHQKWFIELICDTYDYYREIDVVDVSFCDSLLSNIFIMPFIVYIDVI